MMAHRSCGASHVSILSTTMAELDECKKAASYQFIYACMDQEDRRIYTYMWWRWMEGKKMNQEAAMDREE
uniref:Uncharacterized protein n=1 Tax=Arundo donax TaxID=35708 RepID=A0A0A9ASQ0_ARUDO